MHAACSFYDHRREQSNELAHLLASRQATLHKFSAEVRFDV